MIKDYRFDTARVHAGQRIDEMTEDEPTAVYADGAYMSEERRQRLEKRGVHAGIVKRRVRDEKELAPAYQLINKLIARVRAVVEHPFAWMKNVGHGRVRYRGLERNRLDFSLMATAYNLKRSLSLLGN